MMILILTLINFSLLANSACRPMNSNNKDMYKTGNPQESKYMEVKKDMDDNANNKYSEEIKELIQTNNLAMLKVAYQDEKLCPTIDAQLKMHPSKKKLQNAIKEAKTALGYDSEKKEFDFPFAQTTEFTCSIEAIWSILRHIKVSEYDDFSTYDFLKLATDRNPINILRKSTLFCKIMCWLLKKNEPNALKSFHKRMLFVGYAAHGISYEINNLHENSGKNERLYTKIINPKNDKECKKKLYDLVAVAKIPVLAYQYQGLWNWHTFAILEYIGDDNKNKRYTKYKGKYKCIDSSTEKKDRLKEGKEEYSFYTAEQIIQKTTIDVWFFMRWKFNWFIPRKHLIDSGFDVPVKSNFKPMYIEENGSHTFVAVHKNKGLIDSIKF